MFAIAAGLVLSLLFMAGGSLMALQMQTAAHTVNILQTAGQILTQDMHATGCLTSGENTNLAAYLENNGLDPTKLVVQPTATRQGYGSNGLNYTLGYDASVYFPFTSVPMDKVYVQTTVPIAKSGYVPGAPTTNGACTAASGFSGTPGSGSSKPPPIVSTITLTTSASTVTTGTTVLFTGTATMSDGSLAPSGTDVTLTTPQGAVTVTTGAAGNFTYSYTPTGPGVLTVTAQCGLGSATASVTVNPAPAAQIVLDYNPNTEVQAGSKIYVQVLDAFGNPVADGTPITISTSDPTDVPTLTLATSGGTAELVIPHYTMLGTVNITFTVGSLKQTATISVNPGPPVSVTIQAAPTSIAAGGTVNLSGIVMGPYGTPPAPGTLVQISSQTDSTDNLMPGGMPATNAAGQWSDPGVQLTVAGNETITASTGASSGSGGTGSATVQGSTTVQVSPSIPSGLENVLATPNPVNAGANVSVSGEVVDQYGNPVPGVTVQFTASSGMTPVAATTNAQGQFSAYLVFSNPGMVTVTTEAQLGGMWSSLSNGSFSVMVMEPSTAFHIAATPPTATIIAGTATTFTFTIQNSDGSPVIGKSVTFTESPQGNSALSATSATTNSAGQVSVTVTPTEAGAGSVTASVAGTSGSAAFTVDPAGPSGII